MGSPPCESTHGSSVGRFMGSGVVTAAMRSMDHFNIAPDLYILPTYLAMRLILW